MLGDNNEKLMDDFDHVRARFWRRKRINSWYHGNIVIGRNVK